MSAEQAVAERALDAAAELFVTHGVSAVNMADIATAAGCSRATLYRHFTNRQALLSAYVQREAAAVGTRVAESVGAIVEPRERLLAALIATLDFVRQSPMLAMWFAETSIGAEAAEASGVVHRMAAGLLLSLGSSDAVDLRARWLVRVLTSMLTVPCRDDEEERTMLERFVLPLML